MAKYLISFIGNESARRGAPSTIFGNEVLWLDSERLTEDDITEIKSCIAMKRNLTTVTILNVLRLSV